MTLQHHQEDAEGLTIIERPTEGNPGTAGLGVRYRPDARDGERVTVEQLWGNGDAEPVYVSEDNISELLYALMNAHSAIMEENDG